MQSTLFALSTLLPHRDTIFSDKYSSVHLKTQGSIFEYYLF